MIFKYRYQNQIKACQIDEGMPLTSYNMSPCAKTSISIAFLQFRLAETQARIVHRIDDGQAGQFVAGCPQLGAAGLEAFLDADADAGDRAPGLLADVQQAFHGFAVGQKIVQDQHPVGRAQELFGQRDLIIAAIGIGVYGGGENVAVDVAALGFFGEHDRDAEMPRRHAGDGDAGRLDRQDLVDAVVFKNAVEFGPDRIQQLDVQLVVQKTVHLQHIAGADLPLLQNTLFQ